MSHLSSRIGLGILCLAVVCSSVRAEPGAPINEPAALAALIDHYIGEGYVAAKAAPVPIADDAEFIRRVSLDLAGRIPRNSDVRKFLDDKSPDKRRRLVADLLESPHYVNHMTRVWRALLLPQGNNPQVQALAPAMEAWLRKRFNDNAPYDRMVRELLTTNVVQSQAMRQAVENGGPVDASGVAFFQANELKPENLAAATSRLFLGVKLECAQCHDHPFAKWSRKQFWEYAAFFSGVGPQMTGQPDADPDFTMASDAAHRHDIKMPGSGAVIQARFLDGKQPAWKEEVATRAELAAWMTSQDNPFFARAAVNRIWAHLFGIGLIDPADDLRDDNPASHPELLDALAKAFVANHYDLKYLIKAITASKTYQLTSAVDGPADDPRLFARMSVKGLTAEQLYDSLALATGFEGGNGNGGERAEFLAKFSNIADKRTETQTSILQALSLMNGRVTADAVSLSRSKALAGVLDSPFMDDHQKLDALYLCALSRPMRAGEAERMMKYVKSDDSRKALADVFWALLNSGEFIFNH
jgi:Protein of unknown function (DUF1549)/Protein of unknown function (DUF1553)